MLEQRYKSVKKILWIILFANFLVAAVKIGTGIACKSQSVIADGIHSFADGSSNIVGLIGIWLASKPRDTRHPYGHGKYEIMASLFIGIMLAFMSVRIMKGAISSIQEPVLISITFTEMILMIITVVINITVATAEYRYGKRLDSTILVTDSLHTRGDILISCSVLLVLIGVRMGLPVWIDVAMTMVVAVAVLISAWHIIKNCMDVLVDSAAVNSDEVRALLITLPGIYDIHKVRSRGELSHVFIDLHVVVSPDENIEHAHDLSHRMETVLKEHYGNETEVNIHIEPDDGYHSKQNQPCERITGEILL